MVLLFILQNKEMNYEEFGISIASRPWTNVVREGCKFNDRVDSYLV